MNTVFSPLELTLLYADNFFSLIPLVDGNSFLLKLLQ